MTAFGTFRKLMNSAAMTASVVRSAKTLQEFEFNGESALHL